MWNWWHYSLFVEQYAFYPFVTLLVVFHCGALPDFTTYILSCRCCYFAFALFSSLLFPLLFLLRWPRWHYCFRRVGFIVRRGLILFCCCCLSSPALSFGIWVRCYLHIPQAASCARDGDFIYVTWTYVFLLPVFCGDVAFFLYVSVLPCCLACIAICSFTVVAGWRACHGWTFCLVWYFICLHLYILLNAAPYLHFCLLSMYVCCSL